MESDARRSGLHMHSSRLKGCAGGDITDVSGATANTPVGPIVSLQLRPQMEMMRRWNQNPVDVYVEKPEAIRKHAW